MYKESGVYLWDIIAGAAIVESAGGFVDISNIHSNGRIISFLEGGYDLVALKEGVQNHINALVDN